MARQWYLVGEGDNLETVQPLMNDYQLGKGDRIRCEMRLALPVSWAFDIAPSLWPSVPEGMQVIDVWGTGWPWEDNYAYVEMEADPAWLWAVLGFIRAHWVLITIAGFVLVWLIQKVWVYMFTDLGTTPPPPANGGQDQYAEMLNAMVLLMMMVMMMNVMTEGL